MQETLLNSGWDAVLVAVPFVVILLAGLLRLDRAFSTRTRVGQPLWRPAGTDESGQPLLCDPDGRIWRDEQDGRNQDGSGPGKKQHSIERAGRAVRAGIRPGIAV